MFVAHNVNTIDVEKEVIAETRDSVTVQLSWRMEDGILYTVSVSPETTMMYSNATSRLILAYNTAYNVSIVATDCEQDSFTTVIGLSYGKRRSTFKRLVHA